MRQRLLTVVVQEGRARLFGQFVTLFAMKDTAIEANLQTFEQYVGIRYQTGSTGMD